MPHSEAHPEPWPDTPWVIRHRPTRLKHEAPDSLDAYKCQWPDGTELTAMREGAVSGIAKSKTADGTFAFEKDAEGIHHGVLQMHLVPGQPATGEIRCKAGAYEANRELVYDRSAYQMYKAMNNGEEPEFNMLWSEWSNPQPIGVVEPDPVPEPGLVTALIIGVAVMAVLAWRRKKNR